MFKVVYMKFGEVYAEGEPHETRAEARKEAWAFNTMDGELYKSTPLWSSCQRPDFCYAMIVGE